MQIKNFIAFQKFYQKNLGIEFEKNENILTVKNIENLDHTFVYFGSVQYNKNGYAIMLPNQSDKKIYCKKYYCYVNSEKEITIFKSWEGNHNYLVELAQKSNDIKFLKDIAPKLKIRL